MGISAKRSVCLSSFGLLIASAIVIAIPAQASETSANSLRPMTPMDVATMKYVSEVQLSPDGVTTAFVRRSGRTPNAEADGTMRSHLAVARGDGEIRTFIGGEHAVRSIGFTPDGKTITFLAKRGKDGGTALYGIPVDGGEAMKLASIDGSILGYALHPSGKQAAILAKEPVAKSKKALQKKGFNAHILGEGARDTHVWLVDLAAREAEMAEVEKLAVKGSVGAVSWSADGTQLLLSVSPTSRVDDQYMYTRVHTFAVEKGKLSRAIKGEGKLRKARMSPDGLRIAALKGTNMQDSSAGRLMVANASSGTFEDILPELTDGAVVDFEWFSSSVIMAIVDKGVETAVVKVTVDQKSMTEIVPFGKAIFRNVSLSSVGSTMAFSAHTPAHPPELYTWNADSGLQRRTHHNDWLSEVAFGVQEVVNFKARDGLDLQGILIRPVGEKKGRKVPLILMAHGGPESHYRNGWLTYYSWLGQMAAGKGYAVLYTNYRGSTGRGVDFQGLSYGDPAGREFDDLVDSVDYLIQIGLVNKAKVGIAGGSYGGYASAWGATYYSNRYAAAIPIVGVSNLVSKVGTTDIQEEMYHVHYGFWPWDKWDEVLLRSPVYYANQSRTPTLILHGSKDQRVDSGQAKELYNHLRLRGKAPVRLVLYPGEGHGNAKAASRYDATLRMLRWFDHFLVKGKRTPPEMDLKMPAASSN